jgi:hypothetical protein
MSIANIIKRDEHYTSDTVRASVAYARCSLCGLRCGRSYCSAHGWAHCARPVHVLPAPGLRCVLHPMLCHMLHAGGYVLRAEGSAVPAAAYEAVADAKAERIDGSSFKLAFPASPSEARSGRTPARTCTRMHARTPAFMHDYARTHAHTPDCPEVGTYARTHIDARTHAHTPDCPEVGTYARTHIDARTHAHLHAHVRPHARLPGGRIPASGGQQPTPAVPGRRCVGRSVQGRRPRGTMSIRMQCGPPRAYGSLLCARRDVGSKATSGSASVHAT